MGRLQNACPTLNQASRPSDDGMWATWGRLLKGPDPCRGRRLMGSRPKTLRRGRRSVGACRFSSAHIRSTIGTRGLCVTRLPVRLYSVRLCSLLGRVLRPGSCRGPSSPWLSVRRLCATESPGHAPPGEPGALAGSAQRMPCGRHTRESLLLLRCSTRVWQQVGSL